MDEPPSRYAEDSQIYIDGKPPHDTGIDTPIIIHGKEYKNRSLKSDNYKNTWFGLPTKEELGDIRKAGKHKPPKQARALYELTSKTDDQCSKTIGDPTPGYKCYICDIVLGHIDEIPIPGGKISAAGFTTIKDPADPTGKKHTTSFTATGRQCEHIVPVLVMALTCGLYSNNYTKYIDNYFNKINIPKDEDTGKKKN